MKRCLVIILLIFLVNCSSQPTEFFIGKWQILAVVENHKRITLNNNWMHLKNDGRFDSYDGDSDKSEMGNWEYDSGSKTLHINGNSENDDSKWVLSMRSDTLLFSSPEGDFYLEAVRLK